jgi:1,4-dihydroxy-2-naphthoate octaprenyltransferase
MSEKNVPTNNSHTPADNNPARSFRNIWINLLLYPTHSLPTALAPVLVGVGLAIHHGVFALLPVLAGFFASWVIHVAGVFTDNHELLRKHPGLQEHPELDGAIKDGTLRLPTLRAAIGVCLVLALATAPYLYRIGGAPVLWFGAIGIVASLSYNGGPWAYVRRGLADPIFFLMFGIVGVLGTYYIQAAAVLGAPEPWTLLKLLPFSVYLVGLPAGAIVTAVMLIDDIRDHDFDQKKGWRTGAVRFGVSFNRAEITALVAFAYVMPFALWIGLGFKVWILLTLVSAPFAWSTVQNVRTAPSRTALISMTPRMALLALMHSALLAIGIAL